VKVSIFDDRITVTADPLETWQWAQGAMGTGKWPGSQLSGNSFHAEFDQNGLVDFTLNGEYEAGDVSADDVPGDELSAICSDAIAPFLSVDHDLYNITVGQFK